MPSRPLDRRGFAALSGVALATLALPGCGVFDDKTRTASSKTGSTARRAKPVAKRGTATVALILPVTGAGQGEAAASSLRNAADLALSEFQAPHVKLIVKDDRGTPEGAREAARSALADGAELILGPLFASAVTPVGEVAAEAGVPVVAFSTDAAVARRGVYLLSFLPQIEVERIVGHAFDHGVQSIAVLAPDTPYGLVVDGQVRLAASRRAMRIAATARYRPGDPASAVARIAGAVTGLRPQAEALLIPDGGDGLALAGDALVQAGFDPRRVRPLGTGVWNDPRTFGQPALAGGWFAAPEAAGFNAFAARYRARFGTVPHRIATLSYDAVSLAAALSSGVGTPRFAAAALENPAGFAGADGVFRFRSDGLCDRGLAIFEVKGGGTVVASAAPNLLPA